MWQYEMGWLHVAAFMTGIFISYMLAAGMGIAMLGLALLMLVGYVPAKIIRSIKTSKGHIS
jgi:hypothetical protein